MSMKILVTGGAGFIGSHLVDRLVQEGHQVSVIDNLSTGKRKNLTKQARLYKMDIQRTSIERVFRNERPVIVVHLAAQMNVRLSAGDPQFDASVNILGTINVLEQAARHGARKVTFASSGGEVYGEQDMVSTPESYPTDPLSPYGISKLAGEKYLAYYAHVTGMRSVALRFGNVYGPRQDPRGEAGVVAIFTQKMLSGEQPIINGTGKQSRDFIYIEDAIDSIMATLDPDIQGVFNVGTGKETSVNECYRILKKLIQSDCKDVYGPAQKGEHLRSVVDITKIQKAVGWDFRVSLDDGLARTVEFFRSERG